MKIHINIGYAVRERDEDEECFYCGATPDLVAYTYFGAPVCKPCWDSTWRKGEDGATDPPFDEITNKYQGLTIDTDNPPAGGSEA